MSHKFSILYKKSKSDLIHKLRIEISRYHGAINGNEYHGEFYANTIIGNFQGRYDIQEDIINVIVDKKPLLVSFEKIEKEAKKYIEKI